MTKIHSLRITEEEHVLAENPPAPKLSSTVPSTFDHCILPITDTQGHPLCAVLHRYMETLRTLRPIITNSCDADWSHTKEAFQAELLVAEWDWVGVMGLSGRDDSLTICDD